MPPAPYLSPAGTCNAHHVYFPHHRPYFSTSATTEPCKKASGSRGERRRQGNSPPSLTDASAWPLVAIMPLTLAHSDVEEWPGLPTGGHQAHCQCIPLQLSRSYPMGCLNRQCSLPLMMHLPANVGGICRVEFG